MKPWKALPLLAALLLAGCGELSLAIEQPTTLPVPQGATLPAVSAPAATGLPATLALPTPTSTSLPARPTSAVTAAPQTVNIFLIAVDDPGKSGSPVGCGDSAVAVPVQVPHTQAVLKAALEALLAVKQQHYGESGLYNALYPSDLRVGSVTLQDGKASIQLSGTLLLGGECDNPRVEAQLIQTASQFNTVSAVEIFVNGTPLKDALSLK
jgi:hypothetical protein